MEETLQFLLMVDANNDCETLSKIILDNFSDAIAHKSNSCYLRKNFIEIWENEDADSTLSQDNEKGYLHYKCRVEVTPLKEGVREAEQIQLVKDLQFCFENRLLRVYSLCKL